MFSEFDSLLALTTWIYDLGFFFVFIYCSIVKSSIFNATDRFIWMEKEFQTATYYSQNYHILSIFTKYKYYKRYGRFDFRVWQFDASYCINIWDIPICPVFLVCMRIIKYLYLLNGVRRIQKDIVTAIN